MFCPNCGTNNEDGATFCANCGTALAADNAAQNVSPVQATPVDFGGQPQQSPMFNQPQQAPAFGQPQQAMPKAPKAPSNFKITKKMIVIAASVLAVILAVVAFIVVGKTVTKPEKVAKKYVTAVEQCDWNTAYSLIKLPDSEFLTKDAYINSHEDATGEKVMNVKVMKGYSTAANIPGNKAFKVMYSTPSSPSNTVDLILSADKKFMLFFDKYKVSSEGLVVKDCYVKLPKGLTAELNGVAIDSKYIDDDKSSNSYDYYKLPYVFKGSNKITVTSDFTEDFEDTLYFEYDEDEDTVYNSDIKFKKDTLTSLQDKAKKDLQTICDAGLAQKKFSEIKGTLNVYDKDASSCESNYGYVLGDFKSSYKTIKEITLSNVTSKVNDYDYSISDGIPYVRVSLTYKYSGKYLYSYSSSSTPTEYTSNNNSENYASISYKYVDGQWKMSNMDLDFYMY